MERKLISNKKSIGLDEDLDFSIPSEGEEESIKIDLSEVDLVSKIAHYDKRFTMNAKNPLLNNKGTPRIKGYYYNEFKEMLNTMQMMKEDMQIKEATKHEST